MGPMLCELCQTPWCYCGSGAPVVSGLRNGQKAGAAGGNAKAHREDVAEQIAELADEVGVQL